MGTGSGNEADDLTSAQAARLLGLAVRSVQQMADRGELESWKTSGGHRRIARQAVQRWREGARTAPATGSGARPEPGGRRVLLIDDSVHYQTLISMLLRRRMPDIELRVAPEPVAGLVTLGSWQPDVLLIDILLPGLDGASIVAALRANPGLTASRLIVVTSLDTVRREAYADGLDGVTLVPKATLAISLPAALERAFAERP